ncbi:MAG: aminotransferase class V-fold PLP-dependent enzyme [Alicyclobacillus sp.]|nr:aminotransferase class V-fold PLP-dependent enzyme [Alicyclobacillus sp.]
MAHVDNLRRHFPAVRTVTYLNTGSYGAIPDVAATAMQEALREQLESGRTYGWSDRLQEVRAKVREVLAQIFQANAADFALTQSTTEGMNMVLSGLRLAPGDEIITTSEEHPGTLLPVFSQKQRRGIVVKQVDASLPSDALVTAVDQLMTPNTRLVVCSHVSYITGHVLPIEALAALAHRHGALLAVDGAQGAGAAALSLGESGVDFYALPGHKWLCGPEGTGALYIRPGLLSMLDPVFVGGSSLRDGRAIDATGYFLPAPDARRFEHSVSSLQQWVGWLESLQFLRVQAGMDYVFTRIHGLSGQLMEQLLDLENARVITPRDSRAGLVSIRLPNVDLPALARAAADRNIVVRIIPERQMVRISTALYNHEDDLSRVVSFLSSIRD